MCGKLYPRALILSVRWTWFLIVRSGRLSAISSWRGGWGRGIRRMAPPILNLGLRQRLAVSFTPRSFYSQLNNHQCPLCQSRRLGGPHGRSLSLEEMKISHNEIFAATGGATDDPALFVCVFVCLFRRNVELKKVNSKYILKSTLTPQLSRKQFHASTSSIERCQSWPNVGQTDSNSEMKFYLGPVSARSGRPFVALLAWLTVCPLIRQSTLYS